MDQPIRERPARDVDRCHEPGCEWKAVEGMYCHEHDAPPVPACSCEESLALRRTLAATEARLVRVLYALTEDGDRNVLEAVRRVDAVETSDAQRRDRARAMAKTVLGEAPLSRDQVTGLLLFTAPPLGTPPPPPAPGPVTVLDEATGITWRWEPVGGKWAPTRAGGAVRAAGGAGAAAAEPHSERPDHVKCIKHDHADTPRASWCGRDISMEFAFVSVDHAALNGENGGWLLACRKCAAAAGEALRKGTDDCPQRTARQGRTGDPVNPAPRKPPLSLIAKRFAREVLNVDGSIVSNDERETLRELEEVLAEWPGKEGKAHRWEWRKLTGRKARRAMPLKDDPQDGEA